MKTVYTVEEYRYGIDLDDIKVGDVYILTEITNINTGKTVYRLNADNGAGIGGNMDPSVKLYHGWRGTTNNTSVAACGLRRVERIDYIKCTATGGRVAKLKLSADLVPDLK